MELTRREKSNRAVGAWGEALAAAFLVRHGYTIVAQNFYTRWGEIDLVARLGDEWSFVEVKLRRVRETEWQRRAGSAERAVNSTKRRHWRRAARAFCLTHGLTPEMTPIRFEQISMYVDPHTHHARLIKYLLTNVV